MDLRCLKLVKKVRDSFFYKPVSSGSCSPDLIARGIETLIPGYQQTFFKPYFGSGIFRSAQI
jgi:hypothetical protein